MMQSQDSVTIASSVLITIVEHAATQVKGVARIGTLPVDARRWLRGSAMGTGVALEIDGNTVSAELFLVLTPDAVMRTVSIKVQQAVKRAIEELVGMEVKQVNIHIDDVDFMTSSSLS
jgi:uncharacterized alkaline shock family protein YloU